MNFDLASIISFFTDKTKSIGIKAGVGIVFIGFVVTLDLGLGLTYNSSVNNKLDQLLKIQKLKNSYADNISQLQKLNELESSVLSKKHYSEFVYSIIKDDKNQGNIVKMNPEILLQDSLATSIIVQETLSNNDALHFSSFWMIISSNFWLVVVSPLLIFLPLFPGQRFDKKTLVGWIALNIIWATLIGLITLMAYQIPLVLGSPKWNYLLNAFINTCCVIGIFYLSKSKKST